MKKGQKILTSLIVALLIGFMIIGFSHNTIMFLGDSLIEGGKWQRLFPYTKTYNAGVSGNTIAMATARIDELNYNPSVILVLIGFNDLSFGHSKEQIVSDYSVFIVALKNKFPDSKIYIQGILPINESLFSKNYPESYATQEKIESVNQELRLLCQKSNIQYVDLSGLKFQTKDGVHLTPDDYDLWTQSIKPLTK